MKIYIELNSAWLYEGTHFRTMENVLDTIRKDCGIETRKAKSMVSYLEFETAGNVNRAEVLHAVMTGLKKEMPEEILSRCVVKLDGAVVEHKELEQKQNAGRAERGATDKSLEELIKLIHGSDAGEAGATDTPAEPDEPDDVTVTPASEPEEPGTPHVPGEEKSIEGIIEAILSGKTGGSEPAEPGTAEWRMPEAAGAHGDTTTGAAAEPAETAMGKIDALVGLDDFKAYCRAVNDRAGRILRNKTQKFFFSEALLISANIGGGYKTATKLLGELLVETGLFDKARSFEKLELPSPEDHECERKLAAAQSELQHMFMGQRVIGIDITGWIGRTQSGMFKDLLLNAFQKNNNCQLVFRVPNMAPEKLKEIKDDIADIMSVRTVSFQPYTDEELTELIVRELEPYGLSLAQDAKAALAKRFNAEKRDGFFYGIHTVQKLTGEFIRRLEEEAGTGNTITAEMVAGEQQAEPEQTALSFDGLIGMEEIEQRLTEVINQIIYSRSHDTVGKPCMHMFFTGNPGTGKTTVARILGEELKKRNVLRVGKFFEHGGRDFCGEYVGHTAPKTKELCREAYGSVLFIDEAYSLAGGSGTGNDNDYGREALATLIAEMENHYDDLVVIFAGYGDEMQKLLKLNPGLSSRVPYTIDFPNYTREQLAEIFMKRVEKSGFGYEEGFAEHVQSYFLQLPQAMLDSKTFGNARFVRNVYDRVWAKAIARDVNNVVLTIRDFDAAAGEFVKPAEQEKRKIGF